jgi:probable rRNA maturation factor
VLRELRVRECRFVVVFVSPLRMRACNRQYRGCDYPTDVLSFGYQDEQVDGFPFLGEILVAPEVAWRQGSRWRKGPEREVRKLLIHGILHLLGYDHETDHGEMLRLQEKLLRRRTFLHGPPVAWMRARP